MNYGQNAGSSYVRKSVVVLADAWGPGRGGISAFNVDLLESLAQVAPEVDVISIVPSVSADEVSKAKSHRVELIIAPSSQGNGLTEEAISAAHSQLKSRLGYPQSFFWVGHDVITGPQAIALRAIAGGGTAVLFMHASYADYSAIKHRDPIYATKKWHKQRELFQAADALFAIGPLLRDRLRDLQPSRTVHMLVPGLSRLTLTHATSRLTAIAFGRLDLENDPIKQGRLVAESFAAAIAHAKRTPGLGQPIFENAVLKLVGLDENDPAREGILAAVEKKAGRALDIRLLSYLDRDALLQELDGVNLSLFLSWHEGFGLSAWEAIGAGIPLIVSKSTGVFKLLNEFYGFARGCVTPVEIRGSYGLQDHQNFRPEDVRTVRDAIIDVGTKINAKLKDADDLSRLLHQQGGLTWASMAREFAKALGLTLAPGPELVAALPTDVAAQVGKMIRGFDPAAFQRALGVARTLLETGRYDSALGELKVLPLDGAPDSLSADYKLLRSLVHLRLNEYGEAENFAHDSIKYFEFTQNWGALLKAQGVLNTINRDLGRYSRAVEIAESMLRLAEIRAPSQLGSVYRKLARALALDRQWKRALDAGNEAIRLAREVQNIDEQAKAHLACGEAHRHGFVQASAVDEYRAAISFASTHGDWDCFLWAALGLADSYTLLGGYSEAGNVLDQVDQLLGQPGRRFPIEALHHQLSIRVLDFLEKRAKPEDFDSVLSGYEKLGITWPRQYVAELAVTGRAVEPKRM